MVACAIAFLWALGPFAIAGAEAEGWEQYQGSAAHTGAADGPAVPLKPAWSKPFSIRPEGPNNNYGVSSPVFAGDLVVTVGPTAVYEVSVSTGSLVRSIPRSFGPSVTAAVTEVSGKTVIMFTQGFGTGPGPKAASATPGVPTSAAGSPSPITSGTATPAASGATPTGSVPEGSTTSQLVAVDANTGKPIWKSPVTLGTVSRTGVTVEGSTAFVGNNRGTVFAVDVATGKTLWTRGLNGYLETAIAADGSTVVATTQWNIGARKGASVVAMDPSSGNVVWTHQDNSGGASAPVLDGGSAFVTFGDGRLLSFRESDGTLVWERAAPFVNLQFWSYEVPVVSAGVIAIADGRGRVDGFDERTGDALWVFATNEELQRGNPVFLGGDVVVGTRRGQLIAVDPRSGRMVFRSVAEGGGYRGMAASAGTLVVAKSGVHPGLVAFTNDPSGALVSVQSPTIFVPGKTLLAFAEAAIPLGLIVLLLGRPLLSKVGPVEFEEEDEARPLDVDPE